MINHRLDDFEKLILLTAAVGLNVPKVDIIEGKYPLFIVERFDRIIKTGISRIHKQDFCQAQGLTSL